MKQYLYRSRVRGGKWLCWRWRKCVCKSEGHCRSKREHKLIYVLPSTSSITLKIKVKQSHHRPDRPWRFQEVEAPRFQDIRHMKVVKLSALRTGCVYPQETFLVLISVRGWIDHRTIVRPEGLYQWKILITPLGIELATFRLVAQCLNQLRHR
jgi:hypothetical protein